MTVHECVDRAARILTDAGFDARDARRDAAVLARHLLGWTTTEWAARLRDAAPAALLDQLATLTARRAGHEPVAYITGTREFYGRSFSVTPSVLIPRPETEGIVEWALTVLRARAAEHSPSIVDIGTGSGCIAITLALEFQRARVVATDVSSAALEVARSNAATLGASARRGDLVEFVHINVDAFLPRGMTNVDVVVSNPPYVPERDRVSISRDVLDFEPATALFAGDDGLEVIRRLIPAASRALAPNGSLIMEIGAGQAAAVSDLVASAALDLQAIEPDLQGIPRIVVARKPPGG